MEYEYCPYGNTPRCRYISRSNDYITEKCSDCIAKEKEAMASTGKKDKGSKK
jgi:hypothetical protein